MFLSDGATVKKLFLAFWFLFFMVAPVHAADNETWCVSGSSVLCGPLSSRGAALANSLNANPPKCTSGSFAGQKVSYSAKMISSTSTTARFEVTKKGVNCNTGAPYESVDSYTNFDKRSNLSCNPGYFYDGVSCVKDEPEQCGAGTYVEVGDAPGNPPSGDYACVGGCTVKLGITVSFERDGKTFWGGTGQTVGGSCEGGVGSTGQNPNGNTGSGTTTTTTNTTTDANSNSTTNTTHQNISNTTTINTGGGGGGGSGGGTSNVTINNNTNSVVNNQTTHHTNNNSTTTTTVTNNITNNNNNGSGTGDGSGSGTGDGDGNGDGTGDGEGEGEGEGEQTCEEKGTCENEPGQPPTIGDGEWKAPELYEKKYPEGLKSAWASSGINESLAPFKTLASAFAPDIPDTKGAPLSFSISLDMGIVNFGVFDISPSPEMWFFLWLCTQIGAIFLFRALVFGG